MENVCIKAVVYQVIREEPIQNSGWKMIYMKRPGGHKLYLGRRGKDGEVEDIATLIKTSHV